MNWQQDILSDINIYKVGKNYYNQFYLQYVKIDSLMCQMFYS